MTGGFDREGGRGAALGGVLRLRQKRRHRDFPLRMRFNLCRNREAGTFAALHDLIHIRSGNPYSPRKFTLGLLRLLQKLIQCCHDRKFANGE